MSGNIFRIKEENREVVGERILQLFDSYTCSREFSASNNLASKRKDNCEITTQRDLQRCEEITRVRISDRLIKEIQYVGITLHVSGDRAAQPPGRRDERRDAY